MPIVKETLGELGIVFKESSSNHRSNVGQALDSLNEENTGDAIVGDGTIRENNGVDRIWKIRVGGKDARKILFKGWIEMEHFSHGGMNGTFCVMSRDEV